MRWFKPVLVIFSALLVELIVTIEARAFRARFTEDPDCDRNVTQLILNRGYPVEEHQVTTQDGYILGVQRIPHGRHKGLFTGPKPVVFLQHGVLADATNWVMNFPSESLGYILADNGFDVWLGNVRGNDYSRRHKHLDPKQREFWDFSWQEMAAFDLPAMIEYALQVSRQEKLFYIGHSQGTLIAFTGFSINSTLASRVHTFFALAPVYEVAHIEAILRNMAKVLYPAVEKFFPNAGGEFLPGNFIRHLIDLGFCGGAFSEKACYKVAEVVMGFDSTNVNASRVPVYTAHFAEGTSFKDIVHFGQLVTHARVEKFDYGKDANIKHYNQPSPPVYDVRKMSTPAVLFAGTHDGLGDPADVQTLRPNVTNLIHFEEISGWNHIDFLYGLDAPKLVYSKIVEMMKNSLS